MPYLAPQMSIASRWVRSILSLDLSVCVLSGCHQYQLGLHRRTALRGKSTVNLHGPCHRQGSNMLAMVAVGLTGCIWSLICPVNPSAYSITSHGMLQVSVGVIVDRCVIHPCQHSGRCVGQADGYVCLCAPGNTGVHCELETCTPQKVNELQRAIDGTCCAQQPNARCAKAIQPDGGGTPLIALPDSCSSPDCAAAVAEAFAQCERRIYDAQAGGEVHVI